MRRDELTDAHAQPVVVPKRHVLVVDDDADIRETLRELLELEGYAVREAENGLVGLRMVTERRPALILLDLMMPVLNGWRMLEHLRADPDQRDIPVVVISAAGVAPGGVPLLSKPFRVDDLVQKLRQSGVPMRGLSGSQ